MFWLQLGCNQTPTIGKGDADCCTSTFKQVYGELISLLTYSISGYKYVDPVPIIINITLKNNQEECNFSRHASNTPRVRGGGTSEGYVMQPDYSGDMALCIQ